MNVNVRARDNDGNTATGTVQVTWSDRPPVAVDDAATTNEDVTVMITPLANDSDPDAGDAISLVSFSQPSHGTVTAAGAVLTYAPALNFNGTDSFFYTIRDVTGLNASATVTITLNPVNDAPIAVADSFTTLENAGIVIGAGALTANDSDPEGTALAVTAVGSAVNGTVALAAGIVTFTPTTFFNGAATFVYTVSDGALTAMATVTVTVLPVNQAPTLPVVLSPSPGSTVATLTPSLTVTNATDVDTGEVLTYEFQIDTSAAFGGAALQDAGQVAQGTTTTSFTPAALTEDTVYFWRVRTSDGVLFGDWTTPATFFVDTANQPPTAPFALGPTTGTLLQSQFPVFAVENAIDPDGQTLTYAFEVHAGTATGPMVLSSSGIAEGSSGRTTWTATMPLGRNSTYVWVARATDSVGATGPFSEAATFSVYQKPKAGCSCDLAAGGAQAAPPAGAGAAVLALALAAWCRRRGAISGSRSRPASPSATPPLR